MFLAGLRAGLVDLGAGLVDLEAGLVDLEAGFVGLEGGFVRAFFGLGGVVGDAAVSRLERVIAMLG